MLRHALGLGYGCFMKCLFVCLMLVCAGSLFADTDEMRTWTSSGGSTIQAKLVNHNSVSVVLEKATGEKLKIALYKLSGADRKYIQMLAVRKYEDEPPPANDYSISLNKISQEIKCDQLPEWSYYIYLPPNFNLTRKWPVLFIMSPGGGRPKTAERYIKGARKNGWILAVSKQSKNGFARSMTAVMAMIEDVQAKHPVDERRMYSSGFSGGARMAFSVAEILKDIPMAGVLPCGAGGLGVKLSRKTVIYGICGSNCFNRWDMACTMKEIKNKTSQLWFFAGAHKWANEPELLDGINWLNGCYLKKGRGTNKLLCGEKHRYAKMMLEHLRSLVDADPERAYRTGVFMEQFGIQPYFRSDLKEIMTDLRKRPNIQKYIKAEKSMYALVNKYYATDVMDYRNNNCPPALTREAGALATKYEGLALARLLKQMGRPTKKP